jgi:tRNA threonylcarbamoyladenosine biosynthesis protein TsaE
MMVLDTISHSAEQTRRLGRRLGELIEPGDLILLSGPLGSGKTCFAQGVAVGLGIEEIVNSPTFALVNEYRGRLPLYHMDFYRLERPDEIADLGFSEYWSGGAVTIAEWPEQVVGLPTDHIMVRFKAISDTKRGLRFEPVGTRYELRVEALRRAAYAQ